MNTEETADPLSLKKKSMAAIFDDLDNNIRICQDADKLRPGPVNIVLGTLENAEQKAKIKNMDRNDPCFCGSKRKYKKCCLNKNKIH